MTFLFTDIEGSTRLLHELGPDRYGEALAEHRQVLRMRLLGRRGRGGYAGGHLPRRLREHAGGAVVQLGLDRRRSATSATCMDRKSPQKYAGFSVAGAGYGPISDRSIAVESLVGWPH